MQKIHAYVTLAGEIVIDDNGQYRLYAYIGEELLSFDLDSHAFCRLVMLPLAEIEKRVWKKHQAKTLRNFLKK